MKVAVIGANGQLGSDIMEGYAHECEVIGLTHDAVAIEDIEKLRDTLAAIKPDAVVNTAAYHNVPLCEQNPEQAFRVNAIGALNLARLSEDLGYKLVHFSTDYVFDGRKQTPYREEDRTNPLNVYAVSKLNGEIFIRNNCEQYFIIRISGIYGKTVCRAKGDNFITTMVKAARRQEIVKVVADEILTPTSVSAIAANSLKLLKSGVFGHYHMTCQDSCSWYAFAKIIFAQLDLKTPLVACQVSDFPTTVKRPNYSVLENRNLRNMGLDQMPHWKDALIAFLATQRPQR